MALSRDKTALNGTADRPDRDENRGGSGVSLPISTTNRCYDRLQIHFHFRSGDGASTSNRPRIRPSMGVRAFDPKNPAHVYAKRMRPILADRYALEIVLLLYQLDRATSKAIADDLDTVHGDLISRFNRLEEQAVIEAVEDIGGANYLWRITEKGRESLEEAPIAVINGEDH